MTTPKLAVTWLGGTDCCGTGDCGHVEEGPWRALATDGTDGVDSA